MENNVVSIDAAPAKPAHTGPVLPEMWVKIEGSKFRCVVTDSRVHLDCAEESINIRPFETAAQALQRVYPGCQIYIGNLLINAPGNREWLG
jgi:hypothetical protein